MASRGRSRTIDVEHQSASDEPDEDGPPMYIPPTFDDNNTNKKRNKNSDDDEYGVIEIVADDYNDDDDDDDDQPRTRSRSRSVMDINDTGEGKPKGIVSMTQADINALIATNAALGLNAAGGEKPSGTYTEKRGPLQPREIETLQKVSLHILFTYTLI